MPATAAGSRRRRHQRWPTPAGLATLNAPDVSAAFAAAERPPRRPCPHDALGRLQARPWLYRLRHRLREDADPDPDKADRDHRHVTIDDGLRGTGLLSGRAHASRQGRGVGGARAHRSASCSRPHAGRRPRRTRRGGHAHRPGPHAPPATSRRAGRDGPPCGHRTRRRQATQPLLTILVGYDAFAKVELGDGTVISPGTVAPTLDEAMIERVVLDGPSACSTSVTSAASPGCPPRHRGDAHYTRSGRHVPGHRCEADLRVAVRRRRPDPTRTTASSSAGRTTWPGAATTTVTAAAAPHPRPGPRPPELARQRIRDRLLHDPTVG